MNTITLARLRALLDSYGADPTRWPADERVAALVLLQADPQARALREEAARLDAALDGWVIAAPSAGLAARVLASAPAPREHWLRRLWEDIGGWRLAAPAFAASLALGALLPYWLDGGGADLPDEDLIAALQNVNDYSEPSP